MEVFCFSLADRRKGWRQNRPDLENQLMPKSLRHCGVSRIFRGANFGWLRTTSCVLEWLRRDEIETKNFCCSAGAAPGCRCLRFDPHDGASGRPVITGQRQTWRPLKGAARRSIASEDR